MESVTPRTETCESAGCQNDLPPYSGRGRKPTKCAEHRGKRSSGSAAPKLKGQEKYATLVHGLVTIVGQTLATFGNTADAEVVVGHADALAMGWSALAAQHAGVRKILDSLTGGSAWTLALMPTVSCVLGVAANHGVTVPSLGLLSPRSGR